MGHHDNHFAEYLYKPAITNNVDLENIKSIAWLGWANDNKITETIIYHCPNLQKSDLYDININQNDKTKYWDINEDWNVSGYDLVICLRTAVFSKSSEHFLRNLKKTIDNNGKVIFDFTLPEIKHLSDFPILKREDIKNYFNISERASRAEGYFSWLKPYFIYPENDDCSITVDNGFGEDKTWLRSGYQFSQDYESWFQRDGDGDGYHMMPNFPTLYKANFKYNVGCEFDAEKMIFLSPPEETITEQQFSDWNIKIKTLSFHYCLNYIPTEGYLNIAADSKDDNKDRNFCTVRGFESDSFLYPNKTCTIIMVF